MADKSAIEWTDATWNPVTGCQKVSPGCDNCYAERITIRFNRGPFEDVRFHEDRLDQPYRWKRPRMIFVNSMSDTFNSNVTDFQIEQIFDAMIAAPQHTYQVLTKRPNRARRWWDWFCDGLNIEWPANIWLGTSIESAKYVPRLERIEGLAPVTFVSAEPLLDDLTFPLLHYLDERRRIGKPSTLNWLIVGGESGPSARPMNPLWAGRLRALCQDEGIPFFFKQWGGISPKANGRELYGQTWSEMPAVPVGAV